MVVGVMGPFIPTSLFQRFLIPGLLPSLLLETQCPLAKTVPLKRSAKPLCHPALRVNSADVICLGTHWPRESPLPSLPKPLAWTEISSFGFNRLSRAHFLRDPTERCQTGGSLLAGRITRGSPPKTERSAQTGKTIFLWMPGPWQQATLYKGRSWEKGEQRDFRWKKRRGPLAEKGPSRCTGSSEMPPNSA